MLDAERGSEDIASKELCRLKGGKRRAAELVELLVFLFLFLQLAQGSFEVQYTELFPIITKPLHLIKIPFAESCPPENDGRNSNLSLRENHSKAIDSQLLYEFSRGYVEAPRAASSLWPVTRSWPQNPRAPSRHLSRSLIRTYSRPRSFIQKLPLAPKIHLNLSISPLTRSPYLMASRFAAGWPVDKTRKKPKRNTKKSSKTTTPPFFRHVHKRSARPHQLSDGVGLHARRRPCFGVLRVARRLCVMAQLARLGATTAPLGPKRAQPKPFFWPQNARPPKKKAENTSRDSLSAVARRTHWCAPARQIDAKKLPNRHDAEPSCRHLGPLMAVTGRTYGLKGQPGPPSRQREQSKMSLGKRSRVEQKKLTSE